MVDDIRARTDRVDVHPVRDDELRMMFTCAHPALDPTSQLALTLRLISGLTVAEIARALLQSEAAVGQRITRAKNKIRHANIPLRVPPAELLPERTPHVLACIYSVFTEGYWSTAGPSAIRDELCDEGVRLAGELCSLMPDERDAHALAALVLLHDSRRQTRVDADGALVPLDEQDRSRWDRGRITRGLDRLQLAAGARGPYLPQAVIAALHATAPSWRETDWTAICVAYDRLIEDTRFPCRTGQPRAGDRLPRRVHGRPGCVGRGGRRPQAGPVEYRGLDPRRSITARRQAGRGPQVVSHRAGPQWLGPGTRVPAAARRGVRRGPLRRRRVGPELRWLLREALDACAVCWKILCRRALALRSTTPGRKTAERPPPSNVATIARAHIARMAQRTARPWAVVTMRRFAMTTKYKFFCARPPTGRETPDSRRAADHYRSTSWTPLTAWRTTLQSGNYRRSPRRLSTKWWPSSTPPPQSSAVRARRCGSSSPLLSPPRSALRSLRRTLTPVHLQPLARAAR